MCLFHTPKAICAKRHARKKPPSAKYQPNKQDELYQAVEMQRDWDPSLVTICHRLYHCQSNARGFHVRLPSILVQGLYRLNTCTSLLRFHLRGFNAFESAKADFPFQNGISIPILSERLLIDRSDKGRTRRSGRLRWNEFLRLGPSAE